jgi:hypothetical protein
MLYRLYRRGITGGLTEYSFLFVHRGECAGILRRRTS